MCGIAGILNKLSRDELVFRCKAMLATMHSRGPNSAGYQLIHGGILGHTRLAVLDTSAAGAQPMSKDSVTLVYNGELYTFREEKRFLESRGVTFSSNTDTEVLLELYRYHGKNFINYLSGIFSFALYDSKTQELICARDPLGVKPFLYTHSEEKFVFGSDMKSMLASGLLSTDLDPQAAFSLCIRGSVPQPATLIKDIRVLPAGHMLIVHSGKITLHQFESLQKDHSRLSCSYHEHVSECQSLLETVLAQQTISDVPLGAFLSGGIDSSLLVALLAQKHTNLRTFSVGFESNLTTETEDETEDAAYVADYLGVKHSTIKITQRDICQNIAKIAEDLDHPTVDGINSWLVCRAASQELTVAISGTGGDELFAGYPWFAAMQKSPRRTWKNFWKPDPFLEKFDSQYRIFHPNEAQKLVPGNFQIPVREDPLSKNSDFNRITGMLLTGYTRDQLLFDMDTASMAHSLEVRVPLLDMRLVRFALSLPDSAKISPSSKSAPAGSYASSGVKRILLDIGKKLLPKGFELRRKRGFTMPFDAWLRGDLKELCLDSLSSSTVTKRGRFDPQAVKEVENAFYQRVSAWPFPWLLMMTELWAHALLDNKKNFE